MQVYLVEVGVLLSKDDVEYDSYSSVYDEKNGYYDEGQYYEQDKEKALEYVKNYVESGVDRTYGVVSTTFVDDEFDFDEGYVEDEDYSLENVVYSIVKSNNTIIENFVGNEVVK